MEVKEYIKEDGSCPFRKWFAKLDRAAVSKVRVAKLRLETGNTSNIKWFGSIGEYRINWGPGYRLYLAKEGNQLIILFCGGTKKGQQADIRQAKELYKEYKRRRDADRER
ncbi:MAG: type II toxin-antitoxin system RelE/ParE family toxin [Cyanobacteria bacterium P01_D01_bin.1]